jgi:DMSO/TMAO reductase YedYZ heme-binding membrane subunit
LSEVTAIVLLLTSNNFSQKKLGIWWKRIQRSSYIYFVAGGLIAARWSPDKYIYETIALVGIIWMIAKLKIKIWK